MIRSAVARLRAFVRTTLKPGAGGSGARQPLRLMRGWLLRWYLKRAMRRFAAAIVDAAERGESVDLETQFCWDCLASCLRGAGLDVPMYGSVSWSRGAPTHTRL